MLCFDDDDGVSTIICSTPCLSVCRVCLSVCLSGRLSLHQSVYQSVSLSIIIPPSRYLVPYTNDYFPFL